MKEHFYSSPWLDRQEDRRDDDEWLRARLLDGRTRIVPVWRQRNLIRAEEPPRAVELCLDDLESVPADDDIFFLGLDGDGRACFGLLFPDDREVTAMLLPDDVQFTELRRIGAALDGYQAGLLAYARAVAYWHETHRFCGACGASTEVRRAGWLRVCMNSECAHEHFPRTDPAVIVRVVHGDRILLGRQAEWPEHWYSVLAGFVEPGESLEGAVRREVAEEAGVTVGNVRYDSSQPWPFPASLMVGFSAVAETEELHVGSNELEDARWFTRDEIRDGVEAGTLRLSPKVSISRHLVDTWLGAVE